MLETRFSQVTSAAARTVLAVLVVVTVMLVLLSIPMGGLGGIADQSTGKQGDLLTYAHVVDRLRGGESYYPALHAELLDGGYGTRSVFNWRTPAFLSMLALFPGNGWASVALVVLAAVSLGLGTWAAAQGANRQIVVLTAVLLSAGLVSTLVPDAELAVEVWVGPVILISVAAYALGFRWLGLAAACAALLLREIAAPYVVVCVVLALRDKRQAEIVAWTAVLIAYATYYAWHASMVMSLLGPTDRAYADSWLQFGGLGFDLGTATFNGLFLLLPVGVTALYLPLAVLGLVAWTSKGAPRAAATVLAFLAVFAIFGKPVNLYWGSMYTPLLAWGLPWAWPALRDLWRLATRKPAIA